ncbi:hypothetical protein KIPB_009912 [Kipferlia bialata]|uniref:Uncharacterized protein n=1 Tax=Kipferlia bialata TaxID=797122 RepID=A0A9K3D3W8_9EUKA|nr:hypothetical protein KIPB_009912 [Kipferlia bialata]|eukprot:g9912.t1
MSVPAAISYEDVDSDEEEHSVVEPVVLRMSRVAGFLETHHALCVIALNQGPKPLRVSPQQQDRVNEVLQRAQEYGFHKLTGEERLQYAWMSVDVGLIAEIDWVLWYQHNAEREGFNWEGEPVATSDSDVTSEGPNTQLHECYECWRERIEVGLEHELLFVESPRW